MKLNRIIPELALVMGLLAAGCTRSAGTQAGADSADAETQPETAAYEPYTWEWLAERYPIPYADYTEEEIFKVTNLCGWLKTQEEYSEYFHEASEYWDEEGNFTYPGSTAEDPDFIPESCHNNYIADATMPQEVMDKLSTRELLDIANNERAVVRAATRACWDVGYLDVLSVSASYREFLKRDDYPQVIYEFYTSIEPEEYVGTDKYNPEMGNIKELYKVEIKDSIISVSEVTLVTDRVFDALDDSQRRKVIAKNEEIKEYMDEIGYSMIFTAWKWYEPDGALKYEDSTFDVVIGDGVSPKWSAYVQQLEEMEK